MGTPARASSRLCRLLLPGGVLLFILLLYLSSSHLRSKPGPTSVVPVSTMAPGNASPGAHQVFRECEGPGELPRSACIWGEQPCRWLEDPAPDEEERGQTPDPGSWQTAHPPCQQGQQFRIRCMQSAFAASVAPSGEVLLGEYLSGWKELAKFIDSLGTAFGLISRETWSKIAIMQDYHSGLHGAHYSTLQSMVTFELANGLVAFRSLPASHPPSGCRTLLRLHRALKWLELFLDKLGASEGGSPSQLCTGAYQEALAPYHSWWVRQAAALAFMAMPSRQELYGVLCVEDEHACASLQATVHAIGHVYNKTQEVFSAHEMLWLP